METERQTEEVRRVAECSVTCLRRMHKYIVRQATIRLYRPLRGFHSLAHMPLSHTSHVTPVAPMSIPRHSRPSLRDAPPLDRAISVIPKPPGAYSSYVASNDALALSMSRFIRSYTYRHISAASNYTGPQCKLLLCLSQGLTVNTIACPGATRSTRGVMPL